MAEYHINNDRRQTKNRNEDIDSKIADFMADIDEIVLGRKTSHQQQESSEWKECIDGPSQSTDYWKTKTNHSGSHENSNKLKENGNRKRGQIGNEHQSPKKMKKPNLIAEYASSNSESNDDEENADDIDELLNEVLEKEDRVETKVPVIDLYPLFEADCRAAIVRLKALGDKTPAVVILRVQLETRLEDFLAGHLSKTYAANKLEEALPQIDEFEKVHLNSHSFSVPPEPMISSEIALLLSLPPPPPPSSPPPPSVSSTFDDPTLQLFYAQLNSDQPQTSSCSPERNKRTISTKSERPSVHHHHKEKKSKPPKTLPTELIQKWMHVRHELHGFEEIDES